MAGRVKTGRCKGARGGFCRDLQPQTDGKDGKEAAVSLGGSSSGRGQRELLWLDREG